MENQPLALQMRVEVAPIWLGLGLALFNSRDWIQHNSEITIYIFTVPVLWCALVQVALTECKSLSVSGCYNV